ncbi:Uncharacterised protein [Vibrio cholerae]|nr:Uncharacterised protein [Vibrio cholerae]
MDSTTNPLQRFISKLRLLHSIIRRVLTLIHRSRNRTRTALQLFDHIANFRGRLLRTLCQRPNFIGNHRKTSTRFPRARGFNRRIKCQQVGLISNIVNNFQNGFDISGRHF